MNKVCIRCLVTGHVQGVFFRVSTRGQAEQLGLSGYVRNQPDGTVEVVACGEQAAVEKLQAWLRQGPRDAHVRSVSCVTCEAPVTDGFRII